MQPKMCTKCKKNIAVVFITKVEGGVSLNEGYCLKCARSLGIPQIDAAVKQMGFSDEDLDALSDEMGNIFAQPAEHEGEEDEIDSRTATFPLLNQLMGGQGLEKAPEKREAEQDDSEAGKKKNKKHKFLDTYCMHLNGL